MTIKRILTAPDPFLKQISKPVDSVTKEIQDLMDDMLETMYDAPGIGPVSYTHLRAHETKANSGLGGGG